jgi:hypothetical protein
MNKTIRAETMAMVNKLLAELARHCPHSSNKQQPVSVTVTSKVQQGHHQQMHLMMLHRSKNVVAPVTTAVSAYTPPQAWK